MARLAQPYSTTPIAIISAGAKTSLYAEIYESMFVNEEDMIPGWRYDDLRKKLSKDPSEGGIGHKVSSRLPEDTSAMQGFKSFAR